MAISAEHRDEQVGHDPCARQRSTSLYDRPHTRAAFLLVGCERPVCKATKTGYGLFKVGATTSDAHKDEPSTVPTTAIEINGNGRLVLESPVCSRLSSTQHTALSLRAVGLTYKTGSVSPVRWRIYPRYHLAACAMRMQNVSHRGGPVLISGLRRGTYSAIAQVPLSDPKVLLLVPPMSDEAALPVQLRSISLRISTAHSASVCRLLRIGGLPLSTRGLRVLSARSGQSLHKGASLARSSVTSSPSCFSAAGVGAAAPPFRAVGTRCLSGRLCKERDTLLLCRWVGDYTRKTSDAIGVTRKTSKKVRAPVRCSCRRVAPQIKPLRSTSCVSSSG